jgi:hypothetical protein
MLVIGLIMLCFVVSSAFEQDPEPIPTFATPIDQTLSLTPEFSVSLLWAAADEQQVLIGLELRHTTLDVMGYDFKSELRASTQYAILPTVPSISDWEVLYPQTDDRPSIARFVLSFAPPRMPDTDTLVDFRLKLIFVSSLSTAQRFGDMLIPNPNYRRAEGEFLFALPITTAQYWVGTQTVESAGGQLRLNEVSHAPSGTLANVCWLPRVSITNLESQTEITPETTPEPIPSPICHILSVKAQTTATGQLRLSLDEFPLDNKDTGERILGPWVFEVTVE